MAPYLSALYRWKKGWKKQHATRKTPIDVVEDLREWDACLSSFDACPIAPNPTPEEVGWVGDAASSYG